MSYEGNIKNFRPLGIEAFSKGAIELMRREFPYDYLKVYGQPNPLADLDNCNISVVRAYAASGKRSEGKCSNAWTDISTQAQNDFLTLLDKLEHIIGPNVPIRHPHNFKPDEYMAYLDFTIVKTGFGNNIQRTPAWWAAEAVRRAENIKTVRVLLQEANREVEAARLLRASIPSRRKNEIRLAAKDVRKLCMGAGLDEKVIVKIIRSITTEKNLPTLFKSLKVPPEEAGELVNAVSKARLAVKRVEQNIAALSVKAKARYARAIESRYEILEDYAPFVAKIEEQRVAAQQNRQAARRSAQAAVEAPAVSAPVLPVISTGQSLPMGTWFTRARQQITRCVPAPIMARLQNIRARFNEWRAADSQVNVRSSRILALSNRRSDITPAANVSLG